MLIRRNTSICSRFNRIYLSWKKTLAASFRQNKQAGISLIEVMIAMSVFAIIVSGVIALALGSFQTTLIGKNESKAQELAAEAFSAVESVRNQDWEQLTLGQYGVLYDGQDWQLVDPSQDQAPQGFDRVVVIANAQRDGQGNLVEQGGISDEQTKVITVEVDYSANRVTDKVLAQSVILTNWLESRASVTGEDSGEVVESCSDFCLQENYQGGVCRQNSNQCSNNGEIYESGGDAWCQTPSADTCCCQP